MKGPLKVGAIRNRTSANLHFFLVFHYSTLLTLTHTPHLPPFLFRRARAVLAPATMGINSILKDLSGGKIETSARVDFDKLGLL